MHDNLLNNTLTVVGNFDYNNAPDMIKEALNRMLLLVSGFSAATSRIELDICKQSTKRTDKITDCPGF